MLPDLIDAGHVGPSSSKLDHDNTKKGKAPSNKSADKPNALQRDV